MAKIILLFKIDRKNYITSTLILFCLSFFLIIQVTFLNTFSPISSIDDGYGYYYGERYQDLVGDDTVSTIGFDSDMGDYVIPAKYNDLAIDISEIEYINAPADTLSINMGKLQSGDVAESYDIIVSPFPDELSHFEMAIPAFNESILYFGNYPQNENQITIPINLALSIANQKNYTEYQQVVGEDITFNVLGSEYTKTIVGVIAGDKIIAIDRNFSPIIGGNGLIFTDLSKSKEKDLESQYNIAILTEYDFSSNFKYLMVVVEFILICIIYIYALASNVKRALLILNFNKYSKVNYMYVSIMSFLPIVLIVIPIVYILNQ